MSRPGPLFLSSVTLLATVFAGMPAATAGALADCAPIWTPVPPASAGVVSAPSGVSADDVWSVGRDPSGVPLVAHFDGTSWSTVATPDVGTGSLAAVTAITQDDVWAAGETVEGALVEHWDGSSWTVVEDAFSSQPDAGLVDVAASGPDNVWAVGDTDALVERFDGSSWVAEPFSLDRPVHLDAVDTTGPNDTWVVGSMTNVHGRSRTLTAHWNGTAWRLVRTASSGGTRAENELTGVAAVARGDVWAVGLTGHNPRLPIVLHWDGATWSPVLPAGTGTPYAHMHRPPSVAAMGPDDVWIELANFRNWGHLAHWDGSELAYVAVATIKDPRALFGPLATVGDGDVWAGTAERMCPAAVTDGGFDQSEIDAGFPPIFHQPKIRSELPIAVTWKVDPGASGTHELVDASRLGLFDSGPLPPGAGFTFNFPVAATYPVTDLATGATQRVRVPIRVWPEKGQPDREFMLAAGTAPTGFALEWSIQVPGSDQYAVWRSATGPIARFDAADPQYVGPGTYRFRTRLTHPGDGHSAVSPAATIKVKCCHAS
jgi:hypothetical protein